MSTILIVEDEEPIRELLAEIMHSAGHIAVQARDGSHAIEILKHTVPDLVLSDVMMPILSGTDLCRQLKSDKATSHIAVILMSAAGPEVARGAGADAFLDKPFDLDYIQRLILHWIPSEAVPG